MPIFTALRLYQVKSDHSIDHVDSETPQYWRFAPVQFIRLVQAAGMLSDRALQAAVAGLSPLSVGIIYCPVSGDDHPGARGLHIDKCKTGERRSVTEEAPAFTEDKRMDGERIFVNQTVTHE